ncbi:hypothetical protein E2C01_028403 [Portunus trituberculatus]|uniref:Uncharacterized protein n=1 Tax=Portunus trituberculatus TaxID=210409 RepID=A0A5B7EP20_PORTR|nr:hypothetical protein [Portunus trituberculatus]
MDIVDEMRYITDDHLLAHCTCTEPSECMAELKVMWLAGLTVKGDIQNSDPCIYTLSDSLYTCHMEWNTYRASNSDIHQPQVQGTVSST